MWNNIAVRLFWLMLGAVLGALLGVFLGEPVKEYRRERMAQQKVPQQTLEEAARYRAQFTDIDLNKASEDYQSLIKKAAALRTQAYWGLSKTYADWATIRYWRGLSRGDYPDRAVGLALKASADAPTSVETGIALAYAYESEEAEQPDKPASRAKVRELLASHTSDHDVRYLDGLVKGQNPMLINWSLEIYPMCAS